jgi:hypothetical protein
MEYIYEKMSRWAAEKADYDEHFWKVAYPSMDVESKMVFWRKDVFNAVQQYGAADIPTAWFTERLQKEPEFHDIFKRVMEKLGF